MSEKNLQLLNSDTLEDEKISICNKYLKLVNDNNIVNDIFYKDLEIFDGINDEPSIFDTINKTQTVFGKIYLKYLLNTPTKDIEVLKKRQNILNKISVDIKNKIEPILDEIKQQENNIFWVIKDKTDDEKEIIDTVYFSNKYLKFLNNNESVLNIFTYFKIIFAPIYGVISPVIFFIGPYIYLHYFSNIKIPMSTYIDLFKSTILGNTFNLIPGNSTLTKYISILLSFVIYIQNFFNTIKLSKKTNKIVNTLHIKIKELNIFLKKCNELFDLTKNIFTDCKFTKCDIYNTMFDEEPSLISNKGKILYTFNNLDNLKEKCEECFNLIGVIDSFTSIKNLINDLESKNLKICYTKYLKNKTPVIKFSKLWHPHLSQLSKDIVFNDINIGAEFKNNLILTGPNAGGKSTFIKSLSISLLFSHTLGIAFSKTCEITPFTFMNTYLNIPDIKGKESLFEAEMHRCKEYLEKIEDLSEDEFSFIIMDEIFSSTNPKEGISGAYAICDKLSTYKNSIAVVTTHFSKLTDLEKTNETFKNYKIPIERRDNGDIQYKYKLVEGISDQFIALELLKKKGFNKDIIDNAIKICDAI